jgi:hypothetical protein
MDEGEGFEFELRLYGVGVVIRPLQRGKLVLGPKFKVCLRSPLRHYTTTHAL